MKFFLKNINTLIIITLFIGIVVIGFFFYSNQNKENIAEISANNSKEINNTKKGEYKLSYSNLVDANIQEEIKSFLKQQNISEKNIKDYFYYVEYFNDAIHSTGLVQSGFQPLPENDPYAEQNYLKALEQKNINFIGTNCRISSFSLFKDLLPITANTDIQDSSILAFDNSALENLPKKIFSDLEIKKFKTFFTGISTKLTTDQDTHIKTIKNYRKEHSISFDDIPQNMSIVTLWVHDELDNIVFIGHIGILLKLENNDNNNKNGYIFLEKLSFDLPYQAILFNNTSQVYNYFMKKYAKYHSPKTAKPFIMGNNQLLEG